MNASSVALLLSLSSAVFAESVPFDDANTGAPPSGWMATKTGSGSPQWAVEKDDSAPSKPNVLKQSGKATFPICLKSDPKIKDGFVEVKFKPISGREDQAAGVIWRAKDADNYCIVRANALEDNVHIYHTVKGRRVQFGGVDVKVQRGMWHTLRVDFDGPNFVVSLNGKRVLVAKDSTFMDAGMVGVWTKADSVTAFDDFSYGEK
jgi:hypothetical protein